ncbi:hypothetical protein EC957_008598 [Mortierella hygrophila]|uniref:Uncharacterized protein n=1 Tax=Mortierella hygrophila TaxID=979708 RepID=A0A9P6JY22_9FUNG|nr:hypothetical protein EC957_008598 [Mortierella hygrophila]
MIHIDYRIPCSACCRCVTENKPVQIYHRAACNSFGMDTLKAHTQIGHALRNIEDEYNRGNNNNNNNNNNGNKDNDNLKSNRTKTSVHGFHEPADAIEDDALSVFSPNHQLSTGDFEEE